MSYDEKPGVQAIGVTAPDLPPVPGIRPTVARDHEYKRHGTVSLLAGIDLLTGKVHALVKDRHPKPPENPEKSAFLERRIMRLIDDGPAARSG